MPAVAVLTDSTASIPEAMLAELHIHTVAYYIHRGQEVLRDLVSVQRKEFLNWLATAKILPTTACPGPGDYLNSYRILVTQGFREIISIHMTSKGSGAFQAASLAKGQLQEEQPDVSVEVVDTQNVSLCQGLLTIEAARAALAGVRLQEIATRIHNMIPRVHMLQTADTLKYLYMGGRIGMAKRLVGSLLNIKPLIGMQQGVIVALGQARSRSQIHQMILEKLESSMDKGKLKIAYVHAGALQEVEKLKEMLESKLDVVESFIAELSPALAVHTGPGTSGLCYLEVL